MPFDISDYGNPNPSTMKPDEIAIETDGDTHEVVAFIEDHYVVLACEDEAHARELKECLERCAWFRCAAGSRPI